MVSDEVRVFLRDYIDSYECLEVLLLLRRERTAWTTEALCTRLKTHAPLIDDALASLVRSKLVSAGGQNMLTSYRYVVEDCAKDAIVGSLERAYRDEPATIMRLMSTQAIERLRNGALRAFADSFILRRDKGRG